MINFSLTYFCIFCKFAKWVKKAWNAIVDALKEVVDFVTDLAEKILNFIIDKILGPIIEKVIEPILRPVFELFSSVVKEIVSSVFMPLLKTLLETVIKPIVELILNVIDVIFVTIKFGITVSMLRFVDLMETAFDIFSGIKDVTYKGTNDFLLSVFFKNNTINRVFWGIALIAVTMMFIFAIIAILKSMADPEVKRPVGKILGAAVKAVLILLMVPFICLFIINLSSVMLRKTDDIISLSQNGNKPSFGTMAFLTYTINSAMDDDYNVNPSVTDGLRADYMAGKKSYWKEGFTDFDITKINYFIAIPVTFIMAFIILLCALVFIFKIFEVLLLYITAPFFVATIILDDGVKFKQWCEMFVAKLLAGFGMVIIMKLFFIIAPIVLASNIQFSTIDFVDTIVKVVFLIGGLWAVYKSGNLITQIININAAYAEAGLTSEVVNKAVSTAIKYGTQAVKVAGKAVATGGSSLGGDLGKLALNTAQSVGGAAANSVGSKANEGSQAFKGDAKKGGVKPPTRGGDSSKTGDKVSGAKSPGSMGSSMLSGGGGSSPKMPGKK